MKLNQGVQSQDRPGVQPRDPVPIYFLPEMYTKKDIKQKYDPCE